MDQVQEERASEHGTEFLARGHGLSLPPDHPPKDEAQHPATDTHRLACVDIGTSDLETSPHVATDDDLDIHPTADRVKTNHQAQTPKKIRKPSFRYEPNLPSDLESNDGAAPSHTGSAEALGRYKGWCEVIVREYKPLKNGGYQLYEGSFYNLEDYKIHMRFNSEGFRRYDKVNRVVLVQLAAHEIAHHGLSRLENMARFMTDPKLKFELTKRLSNPRQKIRHRSSVQAHAHAQLLSITMSRLCARYCHREQSIDPCLPLAHTLTDALGYDDAFTAAQVAIAQSVVAISAAEALVVIFSPLCPGDLSYSDYQESTRSTLLDDLREYTSSSSGCDLRQLTLERLCQVIADEENEVLFHLETELEAIDQAMAFADNRILSSVNVWRQWMGKYRVYLHSKHDSLTQYRILTNTAHCFQNVSLKSPRSVEEDSRKDNSSVKAQHESHINDLKSLHLELDSKTRAVLEHCESTFNALMATMSILESQMAFREAEEVTKLTQLAFFFIPLTFVAGVFGMNLAEFASDPTNHLKAWYWAVASVFCVAATYFVLYAGKFAGRLHKSREFSVFKRSWLGFRILGYIRRIEFLLSLRWLRERISNWLDARVAAQDEAQAEVGDLRNFR